MRTRQGETICLGEWIRPASADFPPAGGGWGGMRAGFGLGVFGKKFSAIITLHILSGFDFLVSNILQRIYKDISHAIFAGQPRLQNMTFLFLARATIDEQQTLLE